MQLGQLACDDHVLRSPEDRLNIREGVQNAVRRFIENMRYLARNEFFERGLPLARLGRKKAVKGESLRGKATRNQAADCGIRAGNREDIDTGGDGRVGDLSAWVGNPGCAGVANNSDSSAELQFGRKLLRARALVVHVVAHGWRVDFKVIQQLLCLARVL